MSDAQLALVSLACASNTSCTILRSKELSRVLASLGAPKACHDDLIPALRLFCNTAVPAAAVSISVSPNRDLQCS